MKKYVYILFIGLVLAACSKTKKTASSASEAPKQAEISPFDNLLFSAITQKSLGNFDKAYSLYQQCIEIDIAQALPYYELARLDIKNNNISSAIENAQKAVEKEENNEWYITILAEAYQKKADYKNAIINYKKAVDLNPRNQTYYKSIIKNYSLSQDDKGAIEYLNIMENKFGVSEELSFQKYDTYITLNKPQNAEKELQKLIDNFPSEVRYRGMLAEFYGEQGEMGKALTQYDLMKKMDPENGLLHWQLAHHFGSIGQDQKAFEEFILAFKSSDISEDSKIEVAANYLQQDKRENAEQLIKILQKNNPSSVKINELYGDLLMSKNDFSEALIKYRNAIKTNHSDQDLWIKTLKLAYSLGEGKYLEDDGKKATELFPVQPICYLYKALGESLTGNYKNAKTTLMIGKEYVIDNEVLSGLFLEQLAAAEHLLGNETKAKTYFASALKKAPKDPQVFGSHLLYLIDVGDTEGVVMALKNHPFTESEPIIQHVRAQLLSAQNQLQESRQMFAKLIYSNVGENALIQEHFGDLLLKKGDTSEAIQLWQRVFEKTGNPRLNEKIQNN